MKVSYFFRSIIILVFGSSMFNAQANSVGFDAVDYHVFTGQLVATVLYDFTDFAMFGGGVDLIYDPSLIEFVSYTRADPAGDVQLPASPQGTLVAPGEYQGAGVGTFEFFSGINSSGAIGTFVFNFVGFSSNPDTPCGQVLCLMPNGINPFVALTGNDVSNELFANGISGADIAPADPRIVPVPAAAWLLLSGVGVLVGVGSTKRVA